MKKLISFFALSVPLLCFGMEEPLSSSTDSNLLKRALLDENAPLFSALVHADLAAPTCEEALKTASLATVYEIAAGNETDRKAPGLDIENYRTIAPQLIEKCGDRGAQIALIAAAGDQSLEKTRFVLENYTVSQEALNQALDAIFKFKTPREPDPIDLTYYNPKRVARPLYIPGDKKRTLKNYTLIMLLEKYGARLSHNTANESLKALADTSMMNPGLSKTRRDAARWLIVRGGTFEKYNCMTDPKKYAAVCCADCEDACDAPWANLDLYCVGKPVTTGSVLGYGLACTMCLRCDTLCRAKELCEPKEEKTFITAPAPAVTMNAEPEQQPALLTNDQ